MYKKALNCLLFAAVVCFFPRGVFAQQEHSLEEWLALIHLNGLNFSNPEGSNERKLNRFKIIFDTRKRQNIVLGSSRVFHLDSKMLNSKTDNYGMSGASIEDVLALYFLLEESKKEPGRLILGLDPWLFNANNDQKRWIELNNEFKQMIDILGTQKRVKAKNHTALPNNTIFDHTEFFFSKSDLDSSSAANVSMPNVSKNSILQIANKYISTSTLYDSLIKINQVAFTSAIDNLVNETAPYRHRSFQTLEPYQKHNIAKLNRLLLTLLFNFPEGNVVDSYPTRDSVSDVGIFYTDGGVCYSKSFREQDTSVVKKNSALYARYSVSNYKEFDSTKRAQFEMFADHLKKNRIQTIFFLPPYHPEVYEIYRSDENYKKVLEFEDYIHDFAKRKNIVVVGSYDPRKYGLSGSDFYDGSHLRRKGVAHILKSHGIKHQSR